MQKTIEVNEYNNLLSSLMMLRDCLFNKELNDNKIIWSILILHKTIHDLMILILKDSADFNIVIDKDKKKLDDYYRRVFSNEGDFYRPIIKLDFFKSLLKKLKENKHKHYILSENVEIFDELFNDLVKIHNIRNENIHFFPNNKLYDYAELKRLIQQGLKFIDTLLKNFNLIILFSEEKIHLFEEILKEIKKIEGYNLKK